MPLESYGERTAREKIKKMGGKFFKLYPFENGMPDRLLLAPPQIIFVEMKKIGKSPTKLQTHRHNELRGMGYRVEVCYGWQEVVELFKDVQTLGE